MGWMLYLLIKTAPLLWLAAIGLTVWRYASLSEPEWVASAIVVSGLMAATGTICRLLHEHLADDKIRQGLLLTAIERLTRARGDRDYRPLHRVK